MIYGCRRNKRGVVDVERVEMDVRKWGRRWGYKVGGRKKIGKEEKEEKEGGGWREVGGLKKRELYGVVIDGGV